MPAARATTGRRHSGKPPGIFMNKLTTRSLLTLLGVFLGASTASAVTTVIDDINLTPSITYGAASVTLTGTVHEGLTPAADGENVTITIGPGAPVGGTISGGAGGFSIIYTDVSLETDTVLGGPWLITYDYPAAQSLPAATDASTSLAVTPKKLFVTGLGASDKTYDGTTAATLTGTAALLTAEAHSGGSTSDGTPYTTDTVSLNITAAAAFTGTFVSKNVPGGTVNVTGNSLIGADAANYTLAGQTTEQGGLTAAITTKALTVTGITAASTTYDGTATAKLGGAAAFAEAEPTGGGSTTTDGIPYDVDSVSPGTVTGTLAAKDVGSEAVTTSVAVTGAGNGNYTVSPQAGLSQSVTVKSLTVSGITAASTTYDGTATAKLAGTAAFLTAEATGGGSTTTDGKPYTGNGDAVSPGTVTGTLALKDVGSEAVTTSVAVTGTGNGNYTVSPQAGLSQSVTVKSLTVSGITAASTTYDGTATAKLAGTAAFLTA
jgi:hypothetical protein